MSLLRDTTFVSRDKNVDFTGVLSCRATLFEYLRHNHLSLRQVPMMRHHKPDLLLFRTIASHDLLLFRTMAETGDLLPGKQANSRYIYNSSLKAYHGPINQALTKQLIPDSGPRAVY